MSGKIYRFFTRKEQPQWLWDLALEVRIPGILLLGVVIVNSRCYNNALRAYEPDAQWGITQGTLLELRKLNYRFTNVPRYAVRYEYEVDGKRYESTRATTGSPYRNWMSKWYNDTITDAHYLQAIPVLRVGEKCNVFYDKKNPKSHSALAHDANSFEISVLTFLSVFPLLMGYSMKTGMWQLTRKFLPNRKMRIRFPSYNYATSHITSTQ